MNTRLRPYITVVLAFVMVFGGLVGYQSTAQAQVMAEQHEIVVQLEADQDPAVFAIYYLTTLGVPAEQQCQKVIRVDPCRIGHLITNVFQGFTVFLTPYELDKSTRLFPPGSAGVQAITASAPVSLPLVGNTIAQVTSDAIWSRTEATPYNVQRVGGGTGDYSHVRVAVIDTGIATNHPDLNVSQEYGIDCTFAPERTDGLPPWYDGHGHGTHVAGTIGAVADGNGVVGVAPNAEMVGVKVLTDNGMGTTASVICGLDYVAGLGAEIQVANMSLGGSGYPSTCGDGTDPMHDAVCVVTEQTILVVAAGNASASISGFSPANYREAVTVSAFTDYDGLGGGFGLMPALGCSAMSTDDWFASFTNYGEGVDVAAPGVCVLSTLPPRLVNGSLLPQYGYASGTSMSSPTAAGCFTAYVGDNPDQVAQAVDQVLIWSESQSPFLNGDRDQFHEPLITCGAPRWEAAA